MSKDIPIIFSAPMVRALLEGRKTMTRRIVKLPTKGEYVRPDMGGWAPTTVGGGASFAIRRDGTREPYPERVAIWNQTTGTCIAANYQVGDRLWVRESFCGPIFELDDNDQSIGEPEYYFRADGYPFDFYLDPDTDEHRDEPRWHPSIHMPRTMSRLTLIVTAVKIARLYNISDDDIRAEGISDTSTSWLNAWRELWESINGPGDWDANPFVVAITFRVIKANIDAPEASIAA